MCIRDSTPLSSNRRVLDHKTGNFTGMQQRRGMVTWVKKREGWPFERLKRQPFKLRYLREDPRGVMLSMMEEGKLNAEQFTYKGRSVVSVTIPKPQKPWWKPW